MVSKYFILISLCIRLAMLSVNAQEVFSSCGTTYSNDKIQMTFTIGEVATQTYSKSKIHVTQGFNQPEIEVVSLVVKPNLNNEITAFPNPTDGYVNLKIENPYGLNFILVDLNGRTLLEQSVSGVITQIDLSAMPSSVYILKIMNQKEEVNTFNLIKQ